MIDGLTGDQRFFLAYAQVWREKYRDGTLREIVMSDVHSPVRFRVNGPLPNIDAWYQAFDVSPAKSSTWRPTSACASGNRGAHCRALAAAAVPRLKGFTTARITIATRNSTGTSL